MASGKLAEALDVQREPAALRERYGMTLFGQSLLAARRLVEAGGRFVTVFWDAYGDATAGWDTFYVIVGSSAAALTGLMFVVISLNQFSGMGSIADRFLAVRVWGTPTVVGLPWPLLYTPTFSVCLISLRRLPSAIRLAISVMSLRCGMLVKYDLKSISTTLQARLYRSARIARDACLASRFGL